MTRIAIWNHPFNFFFHKKYPKQGFVNFLSYLGMGFLVLRMTKEYRSDEFLIPFSEEQGGTAYVIELTSFRMIACGLVHCKFGSLFLILIIID